MNETILIPTIGGVLVAMVTASPAILKEFRESGEAAEDRKLALETIEALKKEIETAATKHDVVVEKMQREMDAKDDENARLRRRVAILEEDNKWLQSHQVRDHQGEGKPVT